MKIWTKKLYNIENEEGLLEEHFIEYHLNIGRKNQVFLISITEEYYHKILNYANIRFKI